MIDFLKNAFGPDWNKFVKVFIAFPIDKAAEWAILSAAISDICAKLGRINYWGHASEACISAANNCPIAGVKIGPIISSCGPVITAIRAGPGFNAACKAWKG